MPDDVQITVTKMIKPTAHGILVAGHVDHGVVHARDVFQVQDAQPGATARVGRIYQGRRKVQEVQAGSDVRLLLERIEETEIHLGDRLLPGQKKDLRPSQKKYLSPIDDKSWRKLSERIEPILHPGRFLWKIAIPVLLDILLLVLVIAAFSLLSKGITNRFGAKNLLTIGLLLFICLGFSFFFYRTIRDILLGRDRRNTFLRGQSHTVAQILRCKAVESGSDYGPIYYTYYVQLEFTPGIAEAGLGAVRWEAQVRKKIYEKLEGNTSVNITYATDDPRIFILEGE